VKPIKLIFWSAIIGLSMSISNAAHADTYEVPVPADVADRLGPYCMVPMNASFRVRYDHDDAVLNYELPAQLTGAEPHHLKLAVQLHGRRDFNPGDHLIMNGGYESPPPGFINPNPAARADCLFGENLAVACTVTYDEVSINAREQVAWLEEEGYTPGQIAGFTEVAAILGHEAIGIVHTKARIRPAF